MWMTMFFYLVALINFSKNRFNVFLFLNVFFYRPHYILDFFWSKAEKLNKVALDLGKSHYL